MAATKLKIFFLTSIPPIPTWGGAMTYYRHCVESDDFDVFVVTDDTHMKDHRLPYPYLVIGLPWWLERLTRTRLWLWAHSFRHLFLGLWVPSTVMKAAVAFKPDVVISAGSSWSWTSLLAQKMAKKLKVPLAGNFMDWYSYNLISLPQAEPAIEALYRKFYQNCDLAFCTSEGMREALGEHPNAVILYPTGARQSTWPKEENESPEPSTGPALIGFAGNVGEWYGKMLERLITLSDREPEPIRFKIFGGNPSWSPEFGKRLVSAGIYGGQIPFEQLRQEMSQVEILLLPMGFESSCEPIERTSFKTKFLDYLTYQRPIVIWGPEYCSAVRIAREFDSAECCTSPDERDCLRKIKDLANNPARKKQLLANAQKMYHDRFHPDKIHSLFVSELRRVACRVRESEPVNAAGSPN